MAYKALDVASYVINYCNRQDKMISNLRLQKLLYFIQAYFVIQDGVNSPCFEERIEAWDFGPVVPDVYRYFSVFGSGHIFKIRDFDEDTILSIHQKMIAKVIDSFCDYSDADLLKLTHTQEPWKNAFEQSKQNEITVKALREYFN